jgi:hypothetical protein
MMNYLVFIQLQGPPCWDFISPSLYGYASTLVLRSFLRDSQLLVVVGGAGVRPSSMALICNARNLE